MPVTNPGVFPRKNVQRLNFGCHSFYGAIYLSIREEYDTLGQCELLLKTHAGAGRNREECMTNTTLMSKNRMGCSAERWTGGMYMREGGSVTPLTPPERRPLVVHDAKTQDTVHPTLWMSRHPIANGEATIRVASYWSRVSTHRP